MSNDPVSDDKTQKQMPKQKQQDISPPSYRRRYGRRMGDDAGGATSVWLISFTDVMALMLTFFVMLFAMSNPKQEDWAEFTQNLQENFNRFYGRPLNRAQEDAVNIDKVNFSQALDLNYLKAIIAKLMEQEVSLQSARLIDTGKSLIISLPQDLLFQSGQATVKSQANQALFTLAGALGRIKNRVEIVGHTDPRPVSGGSYPSNWELSLARATNVAAVLENVGYEQDVVVRGQASGRYDDLPDTVSATDRLDLSRRVDIVVMEDDGRRSLTSDLSILN
ncbi:MAG: OmpA family protein [Alphaproteobacteria bacterium]|nr:OmpA family protein [Alphaproteobacteria bacterium]